MKDVLKKFFGKSALPALVAGTVLAVMSPVSALAQARGRAVGPSVGRSYSGHRYVAPHAVYHGGAVYGGYHSGYYGYGYGYHGGYVAPGFGFSLSFGAPYYYPAYPYVAPVAPPPPPPPCGYYDPAGYFHATPCAAPGYTY